MSRYTLNASTSVAARRDIYGGPVPRVEIAVARSSDTAPILEMEPEVALALSRELRRAAKSLQPNARASR